MKKDFLLTIARQILVLVRIYIVAPIFIALLLVFSLVEIVNAKDFSIQGNTYQISETSILKVIEERLLEVDLDKLNQKMAEGTKRYAERPTALSGITKAIEQKEYLYDPSYTLEQDIKDHKGEIIHLSGTKINPLAHVPLREDLIFIDGDDSSHVKLALEIREQKQGKLKIILIKGSPIQLQREYKEQKIWFYFDQAGIITTKLGIKEIPALVEQDGLMLKIKTFPVEVLASHKQSIGKTNKRKEKGNEKNLLSQINAIQPRGEFYE